MSFRLVPNSVTLYNLERRNSPNFTEFGSFRADYVKVAEDTPYFLQQKCRPGNLVLVIHHLWRYWQRITPSESVKVRHSAPGP